MLTGLITADPFGVLVAFGAGILSFLSPCVLPLVPGYLSMVTGLSASELEAIGPSRPAEVNVAASQPVSARAPLGSATTTAALAEAGAADVVAPEAAPALKPLLRGIGLFVAGFTVVFVSLGAAASGIGHLLGSHKQALSVVAGGVVVALGVVLLLGALPSGFWVRLGSGRAGLLARVIGDRRFEVRPSALGVWAAPVMGMAFAFAWTPCIGPVLAAVLGLAATRSTLAGGVLLLFFYSLGLGVPFLVTGLAFGRLTTVYARARKGLWIVHLVAGGILVAFGALLLAGQLGWLSSQFSTLLNHLGLHRLTSS